MTHCSVCGNEVNTPYCPMCGAKMPTSALHEIRDHCSKYVRTKEQRAKYFRDRHSDYPEWALAEEALAVKWKRWVEALNNAIEQEDKAKEAKP